jgi:hypothetical protein
MIPLSLIRQINWNRVAWPGAVAVMLALGAFSYAQHVALARAEQVYKNPRAVNSVRVVREAGPVRIVTRTLRTAGREEITREESRGPVLTASDHVRVSEPVFAPASRSDKWLVGVAAEPFHLNVREGAGFAIYGGRSFGPIDAAAGISGQGRASLLLLVRF